VQIGIDRSPDVARQIERDLLALATARENLKVDLSHAPFHRDAGEDLAARAAYFLWVSWASKRS
jgi:hypothetical protein